jgi:hypothetical protein
MKTIDRKPLILRAVMLGLSVLAFFLDLGILMIPLTGSLSAESLWSVAKMFPATIAYETIYSFVLEIAFFATLIPIALSVFSLIRKKKYGFIISIIYQMVFQLAVLVFHAFFHYLSLTAIVLASVSLVLVFGIFGVLLWTKDPSEESKPEPVAPKSKFPAIGILVVDIVEVLSLVFSVLFVPLYTLGTGKSVVFATLLSSGTAATDDTIFFLANLLLMLVLFLFFLPAVTSFFLDKKKFIENSKSLTVYGILFAMEFFLMGYIVRFYYAYSGVPASSLSYIPVVILYFLTLVFAFFKGRFDALNQKPEVLAKEEKKKGYGYRKVQPLIYIFLVTAVTVASLFLVFIRVKFTSSSYSQFVEETGIHLLTDYPSLGSGYQILAFLIVAMLICSAIGLLLSLASLLAGYRHYLTIAKATVYVNVFFMLIFGVSGFYFSIATEINLENTKKLLEFYNITYDANTEYSLSTDTIYALIGDIVIVAVMLARKAMEGKKDALVPEEAEEAPALPAPAAPAALGAEETPAVFDPCPAFTEIDSKADAFKKDLAERKKLSVKDPTLNGLVKFVVNYARDSRLHLSYNEQDMAAFVSGLGACRLTILQGMSGTGKTSLPKIFSEAIDGNCDIIEVESSWKDKNELLGYYNEFSEKYTPKKFTQALYEACLNPEIPTFIVLDEMNLSRIEYYFSDFLSLMENEEDKRSIKLLNIELSRKDEDGTHPYLALEEGHTVKVPTNIWFIGTANRDESTFVISDKVYDRAHTMNFNKRAPKVRDFSDPIPQQFYTYATIAQLFDDAKKKGTFDAENNPLIQKTEALLAPYNISFGNRILKQFEDFVNIYTACFEGKNVKDEAVETILLSKVVSKLEVKTIEDKEGLAKEFENLNLLRCAEFIRKLNED